MPVPDVHMTFDAENLTTFIKELLNLETNIILHHKRFDVNILFKCNDNVQIVRDAVFNWLVDKKKEQKPSIREAIASHLDSKNKEGA